MTSGMTTLRDTPLLAGEDGYTQATAFALSWSSVFNIKEQRRTAEYLSLHSWLIISVKPREKVLERTRCDNHVTSWADTVSWAL